MRNWTTARIAPATAALLLLGACSGDAPPPADASEDASDRASSEAAAPTPLILAAGEGERRTWRFGDGIPFQLKVGPLNGGSERLVMGYEELPPGVTIPAHRHLGADEIIFVHRGSGTARVGSREAPIATGATVYIPRDSTVTLTNTGSEPLAIAFVFSAPGFEQYLRDMSVPDGEAVVPLTGEEIEAIQEDHTWHVIFE